MSKTTQSFGFGPWALSDSTKKAMRALQRSAIDNDNNENSGIQGKEGFTKLYTIRGIEYAVKIFRQNKAVSTLKKEFDLQNKAAQFGVAPEAYYFDGDQKFIVMRKLKSTILEAFGKRKSLTKKQQHRMIDIFDKLDEAGIMQNDGNPRNLMIDEDGQLYVIDFGFAKRITPKLWKKWGENPNTATTLWMFASQLKKHGFSLPIITEHISQYRERRS